MSPSAPSEYQSSQAREILQPVTYSPISPQVFTTTYQDVPPGHEIFMHQEFESQHAPPPKPPKLPQEPLDEVQRVTEVAAQQTLYPFQGTMYHPKPSNNEVQHQYQNIAEQLQRKSTPTAKQTAESVPSDEQQQNTAILSTFQAPKHWNNSSVSDDIDQNHITQQVVDTLVSPIATKNPSSEHVDYDDDICLTLPSIQDQSKSTATQNPECILSHPHQQNCSGHPYSSQPDFSPQHILSTVDALENSSARSGKESAEEHGIQKPIEGKSELRQDDSFYWHKESRPSSALSDITSDELEPRNAESSGSIHDSKVLENKSIDNRLASEVHNASVLGFGGPSDWEHFGDYEAQEVDDMDLYDSSSLRPISTTVIPVELPVGDFSTENQHQPDGTQLFKHPEHTSSPDTLSPPPPDSNHQVSQDDTVPAESRHKNTLKLTSVVPLIHDSSNVMGIVEPQYTQETDLKDTIQLWAENMPSQTKDSTASHLKLTSGTTSDSTVSSGNAVNGPAFITNSISGSTKGSSVNEYTHLRSSDSLEDKGTSSLTDSIIRPYYFSSIQKNPKVDNDTVGINTTDLLLGSQASIQPLRFANMPVDRTDVGQHGAIILHDTSNGVAEATFIDKLMYDTVADHKSNSTVLTQTDGSQTVYDELEPNSLSLSPDLTDNAMQRHDNQDVSDALASQINPLEEKINADPLTTSDGAQVPAKAQNRVSLKETANKQELHHSGFDVVVPQIAHLEQQEATKFSVVNKAVSKDGSDIDHNGRKASYIVTESGVCTADATLHINDTENSYGNLDAWGRASLSRYLSMLREEAEAKTDREKLTIFMVFTRRETRLRAVLYGLEDETTTVEDRNPRKHLAKVVTKRSQKALPALPSVGESLQPPMLHRAPEETSISQGDLNASDPKIESSYGLDVCSGSESPTDEMQYSPGGRPIVSRGQYNEAKSHKSAVELTLREKVSKVFTQVAGYASTTSSPSSNAPILVGSEVVGSQKPPYVPFKYENHAGPTKYALDRWSASRSYAALNFVSSSNKSTHIKILDGEGLEAIADPHDKHSQTQNASKVNEDVISLESAEVKGQTIVSPDLRRFVKADFDPLIAVLSFSENLPVDSLQLQELNAAIDSFPDDFSFIHQSVVAWDTIAKKERATHERERHLRQGDSERKIDALFDDNEIGYGDISELESEFKNSEAAKKADEDRGEYQTFISGVFDVVWTRLHSDIAQLTPLSNKCLQLVNDSLVGKDMFELSSEKSTLAPTMGLLLALHQKLEIRHQKAFEAVLERDRRLKKTEISPWYTLGNVTKVKQLEKQFDSAEKKAIVEFCEQRRDRANTLMDVLDTNTLRGVGANQDYMEAIMKSIRRIASGRAFASMPSSEAGLGVDEVNKAKRITTILTSSSEQIVQTFHVADMLLNAADYEISVAKAKLGNADADTFVRLKKEKATEDQKLMENLEHRLALIREDSRKTHDEIVKLLLFLGDQNGHALSPTKATSLTPGVPGPEDRILGDNEAKKRSQGTRGEASYLM